MDDMEKKRYERALEIGKEYERTGDIRVFFKSRGA